MNSIVLAALGGLVLFHSLVDCRAAAWPQFRGPNSQGIAANNRPPREFGPETNLLWKLTLPPGVSSPCIWGDKIFLTGFDHGKLEVICADRPRGEILWRKVTPVEAVEEIHPVSSPAATTPATDGERVYIYAAPYGLVAYDFSGTEVWRKPLPVDFVINGSGTSPALIRGMVVLSCDQQDGKSFLISLDAKTGTTRWRTERPEFASSYSTPVLLGDDVVVSGSLRVVGYSLQDGRERWSARGLEAVSVCPTPAIDDSHVYVMSRSFGGSKPPAFSAMLPEMDTDGDNRLTPKEGKGLLASPAVFKSVDTNKDGVVVESEWNGLRDFIAKGDYGIFALRHPGKGDVTDSHVAWKNTRGVGTVSSPLAYRGRVYVVQDGGRVTCYEGKSGNILYAQERLGAEGEYYASPIAADGRIFLASTRGKITSIGAGDTLEVIGRADLKESVMATPAVVENNLYVRSANTLWAFGSK